MDTPDYSQHTEQQLRQILGRIASRWTSTNYAHTREQGKALGDAGAMKIAQ